MVEVVRHGGRMEKEEKEDVLELVGVGVIISRKRGVY